MLNYCYNYDSLMTIVIAKNEFYHLFISQIKEE